MEPSADDRDLLICALADALVEQCQENIYLRKGHRDAFADPEAFQARKQAGLALAAHSRSFVQTSASVVLRRSKEIQAIFSDLNNPPGTEFPRP